MTASMHKSPQSSQTTELSKVRTVGLQSLSLYSTLPVSTSGASWAEESNEDDSRSDAPRRGEGERLEMASQGDRGAEPTAKLPSSLSLLMGQGRTIISVCVSSVISYIRVIIVVLKVIKAVVGRRDER